MGIARNLGLSAVLFAVLVAGCGGDQSVDPGAGDRLSESATYYPPGPTREFVIPGEDNTIQYFGHEGSGSEREEASAVVAGWMRARAAKDWQRDCSYISKAYMDNLVTDAEGVSKGKVDNCPQALAFFKRIASGDFVNTMTGPIDSLRVGGKFGYAQYHGRSGIDWIVPMEHEDGEWKVAVSAPINRLR